VASVGFGWPFHSTNADVGDDVDDLDLDNAGDRPYVGVVVVVVVVVGLVPTTNLALTEAGDRP
jgi:hypothetical protein